MKLFAKINNFFYERRKKKYAKTVKNSKAMKEDRWLALVALAEYASYGGKEIEFAISALLTRFNYNLDNGILDSREKERAMESIFSYPHDKIKSIVSQHLRTTELIAWPIKLLLRVCDEREVMHILYECLDFGDVVFDRAKVDKNYDILCQLQEMPVSAESMDFEHFLRDNDERVRFAAMELIVRQSKENSSEVLEEFLLDSSPENTRLHQRVLDVYIEKRWAVKNKRAFKKTPTAALVTISKNGLLKRLD